MNIEPPAQKSLNITPQHVDTESLVEVGTRQLQEESGSTDGHIQEENPTPQTSNDQSSEPLSNQEESGSTDGHIQEENPTPQTSNDQSSEPLSNPPRRHRAVPPLLEAESKNFIELLRTQRLAILLLICEYGSNPESSQNHMPVVLCMLQFMVSERCRISFGVKGKFCFKGRGFAFRTLSANSFHGNGEDDNGFSGRGGGGGAENGWQRNSPSLKQESTGIIVNSTTIAPQLQLLHLSWIDLT
nr:uncharacterized protein LOC109187862 [Ipomoea batatas]